MKKIYVYLAFASVFFTIVWGVGLLIAVYVLRKTKNISETDLKKNRDLRGTRFLAYGGLVLNTFMIIMIVWNLISTHLLN